MLPMNMLNCRRPALEHAGMRQHQPRAARPGRRFRTVDLTLHLLPFAPCGARRPLRGWLALDRPVATASRGSLLSPFAGLPLVSLPRLRLDLYVRKPRDEAPAPARGHNSRAPRFAAAPRRLLARDPHFSASGNGDDLQTRGRAKQPAIHTWPQCGPGAHLLHLPLVGDVSVRASRSSSRPGPPRLATSRAHRHQPVRAGAARASSATSAGVAVCQTPPSVGRSSPRSRDGEGLRGVGTRATAARSVSRVARPRRPPSGARAGGARHPAQATRRGQQLRLVAAIPRSRSSGPAPPRAQPGDARRERPTRSSRPRRPTR